MIIQCPQCAKRMEVPDDAEGKQTACPTCNHTFVIAAPAEQGAVAARPVDEPAPSPSPKPAPEPATPTAQASPPPAPPQPPVAQPATPGPGPSWRRRSVKELGVWRYVALIGGTLGIISFFTVWWSASMAARYHDLAEVVREAKQFEASLPPEGQRTWQHQQQAMQLQQRGQQQLSAFQQAMKADLEKGEKRLKDTEEFTDEVLDEDEIGQEFQEKCEGDLESSSPTGAVVVQQSTCGWDFTRGILTFVFSIIAVALLSAVMYVPSLQRFGWAATLPAAALGVTSAILALTFVTGAPGDDFRGQVITTSMTVREGGWIALGGSAILAVFAGIDGAVSLVSKPDQSKA